MHGVEQPRPAHDPHKHCVVVVLGVKALELVAALNDTDNSAQDLSGRGALRDHLAEELVHASHLVACEELDDLLVGVTSALDAVELLAV